MAPTGVLCSASPTDTPAANNENGASKPTTNHYFNLLIFSSYRFERDRVRRI